MGVSIHCKDCCKLFNLEAQTKDTWKEKRKAYNEKARENIMFLCARRRAKEKGLEFSLSRDDIIIPENCPVLGIPLYRNAPKYSDNTPALDRVDNSKGYIKDNIFVISFRANRIKNNATIEELKKIVEYMSRTSKDQLEHHQS